MTICNDHQSEVCYESRDCPACQIQQELDELKEEIKKLERQIEELENRE